MTPSKRKTNKSARSPSGALARPTVIPPSDSTPSKRSRSRSREKKRPAGGAIDRSKIDFNHFYNVLRFAFCVFLVCGMEWVLPTSYGKFAAPSNSALASFLKFTIPSSWGWWCMELPPTLMIFYVFWYKGGPISHLPQTRFLATVFSLHYAYRGWIFPFFVLQSHPESKGFSLSMALMSWLVTFTHGYLTAIWLSTYAVDTVVTSKRYFRSANFRVGALLYYTGVAMVIYHDKLMADLRRMPDAPRYVILRGGLFDYATSAQYFVELWFWFGFWVLMGFGPNGAYIFMVSLMNLLPRSISNYDFYVKQFGEEFTNLNRTKLIPFVW